MPSVWRPSMHWPGACKRWGEMTMKNAWLIRVAFSLLPALLSGFACAGASGPFLSRVSVDNLQLVADDFLDLEDSRVYFLDADAWLGSDIDKAWLKLDMQRDGGRSRRIELQLLYSHQLSSYWDLQLGVRHDAMPRPDQDWLAAGFRGVAPLYVDADVAFFLGESGQTSLRMTLHKKLVVSQKLALRPELEMNAYGRNDNQRELGAGLADLRAELRFAYQVTDKIAPYIGLEWTKKYGNTAQLARRSGAATGATTATIGVSFWF